MSPEILFEDHHYIAVHKPGGILTQAPKGVPSMEYWVKNYIKSKYQKPAGVYLGIPHRLDKPVSGVLLFARNTKAAQKIALQFQLHQVQKTYWAICEDDSQKQLTPSGTFVDWIKKNPGQFKPELVGATIPGARQAITNYQLIHREDAKILIELQPKTGRTHQLRLALSHRSLPISGDSDYGSSVNIILPDPTPHFFDLSCGSNSCGARETNSSETNEKTYEQKYNCSRACIALHAKSLEFEHPFRKTPVLLEAPLPDYWTPLLESMNYTGQQRMIIADD